MALNYGKYECKMLHASLRCGRPRKYTGRNQCQSDSESIRDMCDVRIAEEKKPLNCRNVFVVSITYIIIMKLSIFQLVNETDLVYPIWHEP